eukprot:g10084.t1
MNGNMNGNSSSVSMAMDELTDSCRSPQHDKDCQESSAPAAQVHTKDCRQSPSSEVAGSKATVSSSPDHDSQGGDTSGCERAADEHPMPQDVQSEIERGDAEEKKRPVMITTAVAKAAHCQFSGCDRTPRYGTPDGPLSFCQGHKRAGQYTVHNGQLFVATRDGSAFRDNPGTTAVGAAASTGVGSASAEAAALPQNANSLMPTADSTVITRPKGKAPKKKKNRPCIFPGCEIRPHYGFLGGRSEFCVTHKKDGMVHLLRATKNLEKAESRSLLGSHLHVAKSKDGLERRTHKDQTSAAAEKNIQTQKDRERPRSTKNTGAHTVEGPAESRRAANTGSLPENTTDAKDDQTNTDASPASAREKERPLQSRKTEAPGLPPSGLAPSDEMRLLQEARESARAAAEASGSGRRPRAPSRRLLEASGKLMCDSIQWMTKEKREEEARYKQEMKEQRQAAAAAGLKFGHRMEALALSTRVGAKAEGNVAGTTGGETVNNDGCNGIKDAVTGAFWRKLTPAETLIAAGKQPSGGGVQLDTPGSKVTNTEATSVKTTGTDKHGQRESVTAATAAKAGVSERKRKAAAPASESTIQAQGARKSKHSRQARHRVEAGDNQGPAK